MRELKFRDYDMDNKCMRFFNMDSYDRQEHDAWGNIMQYTGLNDKKGVAIYEGDIVQTTLPHAGKIVIGFVFFCSTGIWKVKEINNLDTQDVEYLYQLIKDDWYKAVIIGNIYQNPELCK